MAVAGVLAAMEAKRWRLSSGVMRSQRNESMRKRQMRRGSESKH